MAGAVVAARAAGLVEMEILMCLGAVLVCLVCVASRVKWVLGEITAPVDKQFGPAVYRKSERAAGPLCGDFPALVLSGAEEREDPGAELASGEAGHAPRAAGSHLYLDGPGCFRGFLSFFRKLRTPSTAS